jgi:hypothetical protein
MTETTWRDLFDRAADHGVTVEDVQKVLADHRDDD